MRFYDLFFWCPWGHHFVRKEDAIHDEKGTPKCPKHKRILRTRPLMRGKRRDRLYPRSRVKTCTKIPYRDTDVSAEHSKADIEHILKVNGIKDIQWTTLEGKSTLKFLWTVQAKGVERKIAFGFSPPDIIVKKRRQGIGLVNERDERIAFRILFYYLKSKLEAVKFGLETLEQEFMSHILMSLPDGSSSHLGERLAEAIESGHVEQTFALPAPRQERKVIEVDGEEAR